MATISHAGRGRLHSGVALALIISGLLGFGALAQTNSLAPAASAVSTNAASDGQTADPAITNQEAFRAYIQIQEQLHNTLLALEKNRLESEAAAASNAAAVEMRLASMEKALDTQRRDDLKEVETSSRSVLIAAGAFAAIGFLVLTVAVFLLRSAVTRLATATARLPSGHSLQALGLGEGQMPTSQVLEQSTTRFLGVIERLEQRIHDMEGTLQTNRQLPDAAMAAEGIKSLPAETDPETTEETAKTNSITMLVGKAETLLKLDKSEEALGCLEEALELDPNNTEALIKKGATLERLQRLSEAIECYDRVIAQDHSMTMAYLYKGAVYNRMERYNEALECYEQALKTRSKGEIANGVPN